MLDISEVGLPGMEGHQGMSPEESRAVPSLAGYSPKT